MDGYIINTIIVLNDQYERNNHSDNIVCTHFPSFSIVRTVLRKKILNNADIENYFMEQDDRDKRSAKKKKKTFDDLTGKNPDKENKSSK